MKATNIDQLKDIAARMQALTGASEASHSEADSLLIETIEVLQELEHVQILQVVATIIDAYDKLDKWYA